MKIIKKAVTAAIAAAVLCISACFGAFAAAPNYVHDPRLNSLAMADIRYDENAVYGFSPREDSTRLAAFSGYDYSDPVQVSEWKSQREQYHEQFSVMYDKWEEMLAAGCSTEEIARTVSPMRNELRLASYKNDPEGLEKAKESNFATYGNENGPTPDQLYEKYGSWDTVLLKCFSSNSGMDAVLGLYDAEYEHNVLTGAVNEGEPVYIVQKGDYLMRIALYYFGDESKWKDIYAANRDTLQSASLIYEGQVLNIPIG